MTLNDFNHLMNSIKGLSPEQARRLREQLDQQLTAPRKPPGKTAKRAKAAAPQAAKKRMMRDEFNRRLLAEGRLASLPNPALDLDDDDPEDQPITIKGEPLSETIIRERR